MRKISLYMLVFTMLAFTAGCDSDSGSDDGTSDTEAFVGNWGFGGLTDGDGDRTLAFAASYNSVVISFTAGGAVSLNVDAIDDAADASFSGTYAVNEATSSIVTTLDVAGTPTPLSFGYNFVNDSTVTLSASSTTGLLLAVLFNSSFADPVSITLVKG